MATELDEKSLGQIGFEAYNEKAGGKTFDGRPIPPWTQAGDNVQANWAAAAAAIELALKAKYGIV